MNEIRSKLTAPGVMTVYVHGILGGDVLGSELARIIDSVKPDEVSEVIFDIYSPGGSVWEGNLVSAKMREAAERGIHTSARVYAAASMATILAVSADRTEIAANGRWLIHNPWTVTVGDATEHERQAVELRDTEREAAGLYATTTGATPEEMLSLMTEARWMMAPEALKLGFVDAIIKATDPSAYAAPRAQMLARDDMPPLVAQMLAETEEPTEDVPPADDASDAGETPAVDSEPEPATDVHPAAVTEGTASEPEQQDATRFYTPDQYNAVCRERDAFRDRCAELTEQNAQLTGQLSAANEEIARKETALQDLQRRLRAFCPATAGTDEDRAATAGQGDPKAYWEHVNALAADGMERGAAILEAQKRWPEDHRAMIREANRK